MKVSKYLLFLLSLFIVWLFTFSYFYYRLQYNKPNLQYSQVQQLQIENQRLKRELELNEKAYGDFLMMLLNSNYLDYDTFMKVLDEAEEKGIPGPGIRLIEKAR